MQTSLIRTKTTPDSDVPRRRTPAKADAFALAQEWTDGDGYTYRFDDSPSGWVNWQDCDFPVTDSVIERSVFRFLVNKGIRPTPALLTNIRRLARFMELTPEVTE